MEKIILSEGEKIVLLLVTLTDAINGVNGRAQTEEVGEKTANVRVIEVLGAVDIIIFHDSRFERLHVCGLARRRRILEASRRSSSLRRLFSLSTTDYPPSLAADIFAHLINNYSSANKTTTFRGMIIVSIYLTMCTFEEKNVNFKNKYHQSISYRASGAHQSFGSIFEKSCATPQDVSLQFDKMNDNWTIFSGIYKDVTRGY